MNKRDLIAVGASLAVLACGAGMRAKPLGNGDYRVECNDHVEPCVREAQRVCGKSEYQVLAGHKETKLYGGKTGYQTGAEVHTLEFRCGSRAGPAPEEPNDPPATAPKKAARKAKPQVCTPGATQRCVGPGACEGGQQCNEQGSGFLPCDCGPVQSATPSSSPSDNTPAEPDASGPK